MECCAESFYMHVVLIMKIYHCYFRADPEEEEDEETQIERRRKEREALLQVCTSYKCERVLSASLFDSTYNAFPFTPGYILSKESCHKCEDSFGMFKTVWEHYNKIKGRNLSRVD